ncbi:hypothetical protein DFS34DRAFT_612918 [Phlyctochytrium arcticum]|nr:hypothetical protein DFS34DRAFT_612918 [Phlyctochytrium arcticum]
MSLLSRIGLRPLRPAAISMFQVPAVSSCPNPLTMLFSRAYRKEIVTSESQGRTMKVSRDSLYAYSMLRNVLDESKAKSLVRAQGRFEPNPDKRRRKKREREWKIYMQHVKKQVQIAYDLKTRTQIERRNYDHI